MVRHCRFVVRAPVKRFLADVQAGFLDELLLVTPEKREVAAISLWETKEHAEAYNRELCPRIGKILGKFTEGIPTVKQYDAEYSTFHKFANTAKV